MSRLCVGRVRGRVRLQAVAAMTRVRLSVEAAPGLHLQIDREQEDFTVVLGRFVVELHNGTISVGEYAQAGWQEKPLLRIVTSE